MSKAKTICDRDGKGIPYVMIISYILDKGESIIRDITDEDIEALEGNGLMTTDFVKGIVRTARAVVTECNQNEIIKLIKSEWHC